MYYIQTIIIYITLFLIMLILAKRASKKKKWDLIIFALFIYSIIFGIRYGVGMDYPVYLASYENKGISIYSDAEVFEPGFMCIIQFLTFFNAHYSLFFGLISYIQIYYVFKSLKYNYKLYPYLVFTFMIGCMWLEFSNGLRQILALSFFIYSITLLDKKHWFIYSLLYTLLAMSMHKSAILLLFISILLKHKEEWISDIKIQFLAFCIAFIIGNLGFVQQVIGQFDFILSYMQYDHYLERADLENYLDKTVSRGIGFYGILCCDILLVSYSNKVKKFFSYNPYFKRIYNLYFIGILIRYAFLSSMMIQRVNYYLYFFKFIIAAHTLLYAKKHNIYLYTLLIFLYILFFVGTLSSMENNTSLFKFFWQI